MSRAAGRSDVFESLCRITVRATATDRGVESSGSFERGDLHLIALVLKRPNRHHIQTGDDGERNLKCRVIDSVIRSPNRLPACPSSAEQCRCLAQSGHIAMGQSERVLHQSIYLVPDLVQFAASGLPIQIFND